MRLKFTRGRNVLCRSSRGRLRPQRLAHLAAFRRTRPINCEPECDAHEPRAKPPAVAQPFEPAVRAQQRFLRDVFRIRAIAQHAACDAIRKRPAFCEPLLKFAAQRSLDRFAREFLFGGAAWLDQNQLLHWVTHASQNRSPSPYTCQTARQVNWFTEV